MRGRRVHFSQNTRAYTGRGSKPWMARRRALPAHFLAPDEDNIDNLPPSTSYSGSVDEYEESEEELPEIAYFWD
jgi:hypothetical protein